MTATQKQAAQAIINIFETGSARGKYGAITVIPGDTGHLTYGRSQTTLTSGNLAKLVERYCGTPGSRHGARLKPYIPRLQQKDLALDTDEVLKNRLRACADDVVMRDVQDAFFDETYWQPAVRIATKLGLTLPLSLAVVYDGKVQGSFERIAERATAAVGTPGTAGEQPWVTTYVSERLNWLSTHSRADLRATAYRMFSFERLIQQNLWDLALPFIVREVEVSGATLAAPPRGCYDGPAPGTRALVLQTPILSGLDVRLLQLALSESGHHVVADGFFGRGSVEATNAYQKRQGIAVTGFMDASLVHTLAAPFVI
jgi:chitosanase